MPSCKLLLTYYVGRFYYVYKRFFLFLSHFLFLFERFFSSMTQNVFLLDTSVSSAHCGLLLLLLNEEIKVA